MERDWQIVSLWFYKFSKKAFIIHPLLIVEKIMNAIINKTIINNACQVMQNQGFEGFYRSLVEQFVPNISKTYYQEFVNRTGRATLPLTLHNDALFYSVAYAMGHYQVFRAVLTDGLMIEACDRVLNIIITDVVRVLQHLRCLTILLPLVIPKLCTLISILLNRLSLPLIMRVIRCGRLPKHWDFH